MEIKLTEAIASYYAIDELMDYVNERYEELLCEYDKWRMEAHLGTWSDPEYRENLERLAEAELKFGIIEDVRKAAHEAIKNGRER